MKTEYIIGFIVLTILATSLVIQLNNEVKIKVESSKTSYFVNVSGNWELGGTEYVFIYNGTAQLKKTKNIITQTINETSIEIKRVGVYSGNVSITDVYKFDGGIKNKELFPISHEIFVDNAKGLTFQYELRDLTYDGISRDANSPERFGKNMKVIWEGNTTYAKIQKLTSSGKMTLKYKINSSNEKYNIRLFDPNPPCYGTLVDICNSSWNGPTCMNAYIFDGSIYKQCNMVGVCVTGDQCGGGELPPVVTPLYFDLVSVNDTLNILKYINFTSRVNKIGGIVDSIWFKDNFGGGTTYLTCEALGTYFNTFSSRKIGEVFIAPTTSQVNQICFFGYRVGTSTTALATYNIYEYDLATNRIKGDSQSITFNYRNFSNSFPGIVCQNFSYEITQNKYYIAYISVTGSSANYVRIAYKSVNVENNMFMASLLSSSTFTPATSSDVWINLTLESPSGGALTTKTTQPINLAQKSLSFVDRLPQIEGLYDYAWCGNSTTDTSVCQQYQIYVGTPTDTTAPSTVRIITPVNGSIINYILPIDGEVIDSEGVGLIYLQKANNSAFTNVTECSNMPTEADCEVDISNSSIWNGTYQFRLVGCNLVNNCTTSINYTYTVDGGYPAFINYQIIYPTGQISARNTQRVTIKINVSDVDSGINYTTFNPVYLNGTDGNFTMQLIGGSQAPAVTSLWNYSVIINQSSNSNASIIKIADNASINNVLITGLILTIDNDFPIATTRIGDYIFVNYSTFFYLNASDNYKLENYILSINYSGAITNNTLKNFSLYTNEEVFDNRTFTTNGTGWYKFYYKDNAGNANSTDWINFNVSDKIELLVNAIYPPDTASSSVMPLLYWSYTGNANANNCSLYLRGIYNQTISSPTRGIIYTFQTAGLIPRLYDWDIGCYALNETFWGSSSFFYNTASKVYTTYVNSTPSNWANVNSTFVINTTITNAPNLQTITYNWNGTNVSYFDNSLVLMMNFDNLTILGENSTKVVDMSQKSNNGTVLNGAVWNSSGKYGGAYDFDGVNDYINTATVMGNEYQFTVSAWFYNKGNNSGDTQTIMAKSVPSPRTFAIFYTYDGQTLSTSSNLTYVSTTSVLRNVWNHVAFVYNYTNSTLGSAKLYLNGNLVSTDTSIGTVSAATTTVKIGSENGASRFFNGSIDEVRIWNSSLSANDVNELYMSNLAKLDPTQWNLYVNQSLNGTTVLPNATYNYEVMASNQNGETSAGKQYAIVGPSSAPQLLLTRIETGNQSINQSTFGTMSFNVTCLNTDCGDINVYLDPVVSGCDPDTSNCNDTGCNKVYIPQFTGYTYATDRCQKYNQPGPPPTGENYELIKDASCDALLGAGTGQCSYYHVACGDYAYCPSYDRKGSAVTSADCSCSNTCFTYCTNLSTLYNFSIPFFAGSGGGGDPIVKNYLVNTTIGATPFYTFSNPQTITLNRSQSSIVSFSVNATGIIGNNYTFYAWANITSTPTISNTTSTWKVGITSGTIGQSVIYGINVISPTEGQIFNQDNPFAEVNVSINGTAESCWWDDNGDMNDGYMTKINGSYFYNNTLALWYTNQTLSNISRQGAFAIRITCNQSDGAEFYSEISTNKQFIDFDIDEKNISGCRNLYTNRQYEVKNNLSLTQLYKYNECLITQNDSLIIEGNGYWLLVNRSFYNTNSILMNNNNITIKDMNFKSLMLYGSDFPIIGSDIRSGVYTSNNNLTNLTLIDNRFDLGDNNSLTNLRMNYPVSGDDAIILRTGNIIQDSYTNENVILWNYYPAINNLFINFTYNSAGLASDNYANYTRQWYFNEEVNDSSGYLASANVTIKNNNSQIIYSALTNSSGQISRQTLTDFVWYYDTNSETKTYYQPYTINTSKSSYVTNVTTINMTKTNNTFLRVILASSGADPCAYTSGNWIVPCSCTISSPIDVGGNKWTINGTGVFIVNAAITNYAYLDIWGVDSSNKCQVIIKNII